VYEIAGVLDDAEGQTPTGFSLSQNYPNPFNMSTTIGYSLQNGGHVRVIVANILGQTVSMIADGFQPAGRHDVAWDGRDSRGAEVASGIYFFRVQADGFNQTRKMVLLK
jgi:flagellar hook assembly protein FlgD